MASVTLYHACQEWQRKWVQQTIEQEGEWNAELYQLFQRRYFAEDQSSDFIDTLDKLITAGFPVVDENVASTTSYPFTAKLSDKQAKKEALQRAVSRMLKADWVVMSDLWIDDKNGNGELERTDEFGPEGDALWTKLLNGVSLFEAMTKAASDRDKLLDANGQPPDAPDNTARHNDKLKGLNKNLSASIAIVKLMELDDPSATVPTDISLPGGAASTGDDDTDNTEKVGAAITRLRAQYDFLDQAWDDLDEENADERVEIVNALRGKRTEWRLEVTSANDTRQRTLQAWRDAVASLQAATSRYIADFPQE